MSVVCNQFYPSRDIKSEYRRTICNKEDAPGSISIIPSRFHHVDRGNLSDSLKLVKLLRDDAGGASRFTVDKELQCEERLQSHRGTKASRQALLEEIETEGYQSEYMKTYGAAQLPHSTKGAYSNSYHNTFQLVKALREHGGGGTSLYHVAPTVRAVEREWRLQDKAKYMGYAAENEFPRAHVTGLADMAQVSTACETQSHVRCLHNPPAQQF